MEQTDQPYAVDAHSHIWTRDVDRFPLAAGKTVADLRPPSFTAEELLEAGRAVGVRRVVLIQHSVYHAYDNSYLVDAARRYPGIFSVVGMVDERKGDPGAEMRRLLGRNVLGFRIAPRGRDADWLTTSGMRAMWECAADTGQAMCCLIDPRYLPGVAGMCERYPDTTVVIDHLGRIGTDGVIHDEHVDSLCALARCANAYVKVSAFYALGQKAPPYLDLVPLIRRVYDAFGADRLMWATDAPYQLNPPHSYEASICLIREHLDFLSDTDREWLLRKTAEQVFFP